MRLTKTKKTKVAFTYEFSRHKIQELCAVSHYFCPYAQENFNKKYQNTINSYKN